MTTPNLKLTAIQLGDSATPANNFLVCVPDIADGTLLIKRGDGTAVATIDAAGKVVFAGNAQTWQTLTTRVLGAPYTNSTGQAIKLYIQYSSTTQTSLYVEIDGKSFQGSPQLTSGQPITLQIDVPAGSTYTVTIGSGTPTQYSWRELR